MRLSIAATLACGLALAVPAAGFADPAPLGTSEQPAPSQPPDAEPLSPYPYVSVSLQPALPGDDVLVAVGCPREELGKVTSPVLDVGAFEIVTETPKLVQNAIGHVHPDARPGFYPVSALCGKRTVSGNFAVKAPRTATTTPAAPAPPRPVPRPVPKPVPASGRQVSRVPVGAPQTGDGGTMG
ncbi:hypothetical protein ACFWY9_34910 [Amycolatopsis sp. NPDC059027]|uniref:hypothetical protein n=1 Tax=unclassified Amycolatopsis TaxID=2618356 RepID=UPI00366E1045